MTMVKNATRLVCILPALAILVGCTGSEDGDTSTPGETQQDNGGAGSAAGVDEFDPNDVFVEQTVALAASPEDEVTIGVQSLQVDGEVMQLRLVVTPNFTSVEDGETVSLYDILEQGTFRPSLLDLENLKEYSIIRDGSTPWGSDSVDTQAVNGTPMLVFAVFAAPQDDIDTVDVSIREVWPSFTGVPIER